MAQLSPQKASFNGLTPTFTAADAAGDTFKNYGKTVVHVDNQDTAAKQITVSSNLCNFGEPHDITVSVAAGETQVIGPFNTKRFNDENHLVSLSYDTVTSLTVAVIEY